MYVQDVAPIMGTETMMVRRRRACGERRADMLDVQDQEGLDDGW